MKNHLSLLVCLALFCCTHPPKHAGVRPAETEILYGAAGTPSRISGQIYTVRRSRRAVRELMSMIKQEKALFKLQKPDKEFALVRDETDELGFRHLRMQRVHRSVPIWNQEVVIHINPQQIVYLIQGDYAPSLPKKFKIKPTLTQEAAEASAKKKLDKPVARSAESKLWIWASTGEPKTVWRVVVAASTLAPEQWECLIDAATGEIVYQASLLRP